MFFKNRSAKIRAFVRKANGSWKFESGSWKLEAGNRRLEAGSWISIEFCLHPHINTTSLIESLPNSFWNRSRIWPLL
jgi:hypothetical protein